MPIVVQSQILPREIARPSAWGDLGYAGGHQFDKLLSALMGQMGGIGQVPTQPTPQRPGQLQFPSGQMTPTSPDELAQLQALGGVPNRQGGMVPFGTGAHNAVSYRPPTRLGMQPNLDQQLKQKELELRSAQASWYIGATPQATPTASATPPATPPTSGGGIVPEGVTSKLMGQLYQEWQAGDASAGDKIRLLALEKNDPEAIALLKAAGEL